MTFLFSFKKPISMGVISWVSFQACKQMLISLPKDLKLHICKNTLLGKNLQIYITDTPSFFQSTDPEILATAGSTVFKT